MINIVLDLDETLIHTLSITKSFSTNLSKMADFHFEIDGQHFWVNKRPGLDLFLDFIFKYFQVGIWTAADKEYATQICKKVLTYEQVKKIKFIYSRNFCHLDQNENPPMFTKPLAKLYELYPDFNHQNTLMIDNAPHVMKYNPHNGVYIPDFMSENHDEVLYHTRNVIIKHFQTSSGENTSIWPLVHELNQYMSIL